MLESLNLNFYYLVIFIFFSTLVFYIYLNRYTRKKSRVSLDYINFFSLVTSITIFWWCLAIWFNFNNLTSKFQFIYGYRIYGSNVILFGLDGISIFFIVLTSFIIPLCLVYSIDLKYHKPIYILSFFILEYFLILSFSVLNILMFYVCFESILVPMFIIIGIWGSRERKIKASYFLFLYTLLGSIFMLFAIFILHLNGSLCFILLTIINLTWKKQIIIFFCIFVTFAVKIPMLPFHIWLPEAHSEAPTTGSVILASLLLKLGGYGFLRFLVSCFSEITSYFLPLIYIICFLSILYTSLTCIRQMDLKRMIAYSSVAHMNLVVLGIFSNNLQGIQGSIFLMIGHGLVSSALFFSVGILYARFQTRLLRYFGGLVIKMPIFTIFFFLFSLGNLGFPGTSNFIGEILLFVGVFKKNNLIGSLIVLSVVLSASYSMWFFNRICFGSLKIASLKKIIDLDRLEFFVLFYLLFLMVILGIFPDIILDSIYVSCQLCIV